MPPVLPGRTNNQVRQAERGRVLHDGIFRSAPGTSIGIRGIRTPRRRCSGATANERTYDLGDRRQSYWIGYATRARTQQQPTNSW